jgi:hypothetical protein
MHNGRTLRANIRLRDSATQDAEQIRIGRLSLITSRPMSKERELYQKVIWDPSRFVFIGPIFSEADAVPGPI